MNKKKEITMTTITEDYVSFETAKLLREKGFDEFCYQKYDDEGYLSFNHVGYINSDKPCDDFYALAPTHQMAIKWLRENYNIYISIQPDFPGDKDYKMCWCWAACILYENCISTKGHQCYIETYEEAAEAAIKYSLENLI